MKITKQYLKKLIQEQIQNEGDYDNMIPSEKGIKSYEVVDEYDENNNKTFNTFKEVEKYLTQLDNQGVDLYNVIIKPKFK